MYRWNQGTTEARKKGIMDQDTRWLIRYNEVKAFIEEISLVFVLVIPDTVLAHWVYRILGGYA